MSAKYFVFAGGRWCEVDARTGRVSGWRRALFCYVRGQRLHAARSAAVLRALRALATGLPGAVRDAAPLLRCPRARPPERSRSRQRSSCRPRAQAPCCAHNHSCSLNHSCTLTHTRCDVNANELATKLPAAPVVVSPRIQKIPSSVPEVQVVESVQKSPVKQYQASPEKSKKYSTVEGELTREPVTRAKRSSQQHVNVVVIDKNVDWFSSSEEPQKQAKSPRKRMTRKLEISSDETDEEPARRTRSQIQASKPNVSDQVKSKSPETDSSSEEEVKTRVSESEKLLNCLLKTSDGEVTDESDNAVTDTEPAPRYKELLIGESDVETLRRFLKDHGDEDVIARFNRDERFKLKVFHRLNPLVSLERCKPLENLLRQRVTLKEFARNLGLRSVAEVTPEKRYRMRRNTKSARVASDTDDKEIVVRPKRRRLWNNDKEMFNSVRESISSEVKTKLRPKLVVGDSSVDSHDSDADFKRKVRDQLAKKQRINSLEKAKSTARPLKENVSSAKVAEMLESSEEEPRPKRSRSSTNVKESVKDNKEPAKVNKESTKVNKESPKDNKVSEEIEVRQTRSSKGVTQKKPEQTKPKEHNVTSLVRTRSSNVTEIPARTLREHNKVPSDSDSEFETSKSSPKKNLIRKGKVQSANSLNKKGKETNDTTAKENKKKPAYAYSMTVKPVKYKKSSVANGREYTSLEDHAIVAWVCGGQLRERRVNGNRIWRELALDFKRLAGQDRSWHSLRNRYLRYILPALGALALPPAQVSRLRAAAAAGEIKSRGSIQRRNSIFTAPAVRSASSALRRREREEQKTEAKEQKTEAKEQKEKGSGKKLEMPARGKGGRGDAPVAKIDSPPAQARVTRSSVGSPSKRNRPK